MDLGLKGKVALVCGASRGIAYATAEEFAREGASLAICSRDAASLASAAARLTAMGVPVLSVVADLSTADGITAVVDGVRARYGRVDVLVTNTGGPPTGTSMGHAWPVWEHATNLLLRTVVELTRAFCDRLERLGQCP